MLDIETDRTLYIRIANNQMRKDVLSDVSANQMEYSVNLMCAILFLSVTSVNLFIKMHLLSLFMFVVILRLHVSLVRKEIIHNGFKAEMFSLRKK